ncbi:cupin domain-containing protein [Anabaena sp. CS-542/02]|jgi:dTDP-4-dehydrorhamnose 3,5-epimerase-like enzyme|uniref:cupin domain-containing protein n=1 Tax=Anabaena sp. CS-542/02 TaxID=3021719 RepID=UPI00232DE89D|nr:cupin [Anabaena sp. CS-542/02]MDB9445462.1 cupin [Anabaena sp. CS-542/02]
MTGSKRIEIRKLDSMTVGMVSFYSVADSNQTALVHIAGNFIDNMFVHRHQTDQLLVVKGQILITTLHNREYQYTFLSEKDPKIITIPPGVLHGAINLSEEPCIVVNAVLQHGQTNEKDYRPVKPPLPYNIDWAKKLFREHSFSN